MSLSTVLSPPKILNFIPCPCDKSCFIAQKDLLNIPILAVDLSILESNVLKNIVLFNNINCGINILLIF